MRIGPAIVNRIAETISKITKTEHFTKRQDYVKQVSEMLKIDEAGLNDLVNKFIRDKVQKDEQRQLNRIDENVNIADNLDLQTDEDNVANLFNKDELNGIKMEGITAFPSLIIGK